MCLEVALGLQALMASLRRSSLVDIFAIRSMSSVVLPVKCASGPDRAPGANVPDDTECHDGQSIAPKNGPPRTQSDSLSADSFSGQMTPTGLACRG